MGHLQFDDKETSKQLLNSGDTLYANMKVVVTIYGNVTRYM